MSAVPLMRREACAGATRPTLQLVADRPRRVRRARLAKRLPTPPFVLLALVVFAAGLASLLGINTVTSQGSFRLQQLQDRSQSLAHEEQALHLSLLGEESPALLAQRAQRLGLEPAAALRFLKVPAAPTP